MICSLNDKRAKYTPTNALCTSVTAAFHGRIEVWYNVHYILTDPKVSSMKNNVPNT